MKKNLLQLIPAILFTAFIPTAFVKAVSDGVCTEVPGLGSVVCQIGELLDTILPVLIAFGVVYFIWGVVMFVIADGEEAKVKGKERMIYGIIGFAVIVGIWGLVNIVIETFDLSGQTPTLDSLVVEGSGQCSLDGNPKFQDVLCYVTKIINDAVIPLMFAVAVVMFIWGVINFFILNADEEGKRAQGRQFMIWGIIALAVMLSIWGLVGILGDTFNINSSVLPKVTPP